MKKLFISITVLAIIGGYFSPLPQKIAEQANEFFGAADTTLNIGGFPYYINAPGLSSTATSIVLTSLTLPQTGQEIQDSDLSSTFYVTLEPGNRERQEFVSCTTVSQGAGTTATLSGCTRGLSPITPYTASSTLQFSHGARSILIFSNPPQQQLQFYALGNVATSTNILNFSSTTPPRYDSTGVQASGTYIATTSELASIDYVNAVVAGGAANGTEAVKGVWEGATALEQASSTILGATGAGLAMQSRYATDTPLYGCAVGYEATAGAGCGVIAQLTGKIRQTFINLADTFAWTATHTWAALGTFNGGLTATATTTLAGSNVNSNAVVINTIPLQFPSSQCASGYGFVNNGSGVLSCLPMRSYTYATTTDIAVAATISATSTAFALPAGAITASSTIAVRAMGVATDGGTDGTCTFSLRTSTGVPLISGVYALGAGTTNYTGVVDILVLMNNATNSQISTFNSVSKLAAGTSLELVNAESTSAIDFSSAVSLVGVITSEAGTQATCTLTSMTVVVSQ